MSGRDWERGPGLPRRLRGSARRSPRVGLPPKSAAPASAPARAASQAPARRRARSDSPPRPAQAGPQRVAHGEDAGGEEDGAADEAELEQHLVVGLLRDERVAARGEVARRLVGEALAGIGKVARVLLGRQLALPARAEHRPVEKDAARRCTQRSAAGSSSPRTGRELPPRDRTTPGGSRGRRSASRESLPSR